MRLLAFGSVLIWVTVTKISYRINGDDQSYPTRNLELASSVIGDKLLKLGPQKSGADALALL